MDDPALTNPEAAEHHLAFHALGGSVWFTLSYWGVVLNRSIDSAILRSVPAP